MIPVQFPQLRLRRLRKTPAIRRLAEETRLHSADFMLPVFVKEGPVSAQEAGVARQYSVEGLLKRLEGFVKKGGVSILLFGVPIKKDSRSTQAYAANGIAQKALKAVKKEFGEDLAVATDLCFCSYSSHGHCGILNGTGVDNDATLEIIAKTAAAQAEAGSDIISPSGMMDGAIKTIREALEKNGFKNTAIMSYAAKYASVLYGPFRDVADSAPSFGNRKAYQMNPANSREAMREIAQDIQEGADIVMVKPAQFYLDVIAKAKERFGYPTAAYQVSGEAWMVEEYAKAGLARREDAILESVTAIKRAGADIIISYFSEDLLALIKN